MGLLEQDTLLCERVNVRCFRLGMSAKTTDPVIQIVDGDEQDVGLVVPGETGSGKTRGNQQQGEEQCYDAFHVSGSARKRSTVVTWRDSRTNKSGLAKTHGDNETGATDSCKFPC